MRLIYASLFILFISSFTSSIGQGITPLLQTGHTKEITCMAVSPDSKYLVTGSQDNTLKVWNLATGQIIKNHEGHAGRITSVSFSQDGLYILSGSADNTIRIWEFIRNPENKILDKKYEFLQQQALRMGPTTEDQIKAKFELALSENFGCLQIYKGHGGPVASVCPGKDLKTFVTLGEDNTLRTWDPLKVTSISSIPVNDAARIKLSPDGTKVYILGEDGSIQYAKAPVKEINGKIADAANMKSLSLSLDKKWIGGTDGAGNIHIWDAAKNSKAASITGMNALSEIAFLTGKTSVVFSSAEGIVEYDFKTKSIVRKIALADKVTGNLVATPDNLITCGLSQNNELYLIDLSSGLVKNHLPAVRAEYDYHVMTSDGKKIFSLDKSSNSLLSTEVFTGKTQSLIFPSPASLLTISQDNTSLIAWHENTLMVYHTENLSPITTISLNQSVLEIFYPGGSENLLIRNQDNSISSYSLSTKKEKLLTEIDSEINESFILNANTIALLNESNQLAIIDASAKKELMSFSNIGSAVTGVYTPASLYAVYNKKTGIELWNYSTKKKLKEITTAAVGTVAQLFFNNSGTQLCIRFVDGRVRIFEVETGYPLGGKTGKDNPVAYTPNGKFIFFAPNSSRLILWNWKENKDVQILYGNNGAAIFCHDNNYIVSNRGVDLIGFKKGNEYYTFEQFDLHYNRPDKVLQTLGYAEENLVKAYRQAYNKRLKKLGFKNSFQGIGIHIPQISVENIGEIPSTTREGKVIFKIKSTDSEIALRSIFISVNGVPESGVKGMNISDKKLKEYSTSIEVSLSQGMNDIKIWCMNEKGAESYKKHLQIRCDKPYEKPDLYLVVIGVSNYKNPDYNLSYAAKDGRDFVKTLISKKDQYQRVIVDSLLNEQATLEKISDVRRRLLQSNVDDRVIVFFAGHGLLDANLDYFLATHNVDFTNPAINGLAYEKLEELLDGIPARNKLLLMDACHSGELDKEEVKVTTTQSTVKEDVTFRAVPGGNVTIGLTNSFEMMKQLFSDLRKGNGTTVISSAGGAEYAMEGENWKNGVFTYCLLKALMEKQADANKDGKIILSELQEYLQYQVSELTGGKQKPTSRAENIGNDWQIW